MAMRQNFLIAKRYYDFEGAPLPRRSFLSYQLCGNLGRRSP